MEKKNGNDEAILQLKADIEKKKASLETSETFSPVTNMSLELDGVKYNLNVIYAEPMVQIMAKLHSYKMAALDLDIILPEYSGFTVDQWLQDLKAKYKIATRKREEARLKMLEERLTALLSSEKQVALEIDTLRALI